MTGITLGGTVRRMTEIRKAVLRSVRLDDDVWERVKAMECSLNQYLRAALLDGSNGEPDSPTAASVSATVAAVAPATIPGVSRGMPLAQAFRTMCEHCGQKFDSESRFNKRCSRCEADGHGRSRYDCEQCRINS